MSEPNEDQIADDGAQTAAPDDADQQQELSPEDRALTMGWTPKDQFKGAPDKWVDAETFVKRGEEFLPFLKANNRRLEQALERNTKETERLKKTLSDFSAHHSKTEARAYERAMADIQTRLDQAAASGDVQGVRDATEEMVEMRTDVKASPATEADTPPEFKEWQEANPWFGKDKALTAAVVEIGNEVFAEGYTGKAQIKEVDRRVREQFPNKFENPNRRQAASVEGQGSTPRRGGKGYADLPADAKSVCDDFVKRGIITREQYTKEFFA